MRIKRYKIKCKECDEKDKDCWACGGNGWTIGYKYENKGISKRPFEFDLSTEVIEQLDQDYIEIEEDDCEYDEYDSFDRDKDSGKIDYMWEEEFKKDKGNCESCIHYSEENLGGLGGECLDCCI